MIATASARRRVTRVASFVTFGALIAGCNLGEAAVEYPLTGSGSYVTDLMAGDVNNDGHSDVVGAVHGGYAVALGDGSGAFSVTRVGTSPAPGWEGTLGDADGDGNLDLVYLAGSPNGDPTRLELRQGDGAGGFSATPQVLPPIDDLRAIDVGDVDGDDDLDVVAATATGAGAWLNDGSGSFGDPSTITTLTNASDVELHDVDDDGSLDLVTAGFDAEEVVGVNFGDGAGGFERAASYGIEIDEELFGTTTIGATDINGDGYLDVYGGNATFDRVFVFPGGSGGVLGSAVLSDAGSADVPDVLHGDFDVDGNDDLATGGQAVLFGEGDGSFLDRHAVYGGAIVTTADFDHDEQPDLAYARGEKLVIMLNHLDGRRDHE